MFPKVFFRVFRPVRGCRFIVEQPPPVPPAINAHIIKLFVGLAAATVSGTGKRSEHQATYQY